MAVLSLKVTGNQNESFAPNTISAGLLFKADGATDVLAVPTITPVVDANGAQVLDGNGHPEVTLSAAADLTVSASGNWSIQAVDNATPPNPLGAPVTGTFVVLPNAIIAIPTSASSSVA
jgi:hypothetical protein